MVVPARVALGELARRFLHQALGVQIVSHVVALGTVAVPEVLRQYGAPATLGTKPAS